MMKTHRTLLPALVMSLVMTHGADSALSESTTTLIGADGKDGVRKMIATSDGGYALAGWQDQQGLHETGTGLVAKVGATGTVQWQTTLDTNGRNQVAAILQRADGSYVAVVEEYPTPTEQGDVVLVELTDTGEQRDVHRVGGPGSDVADTILQTEDGGYLLAGESARTTNGDMDAWVAKLSPNFELDWDWRHSTPGRDRFNGIAILPDGSFIAAGNETMAGIMVGTMAGATPEARRQERALLVKFDATGDVLWSVTPEKKQPTSIRGLVATDDGGVAFAGFSKRLSDGSFDGWVGKVSAAGETVWHKTIEQDGPDFLHGVIKSLSGHYLAAGAVRTAANGYDALVIAFVEDGSSTSSVLFGSDGAEQARAILQTPKDEIILAGTHTAANSQNEDMWFFRTNH